METEFGSSTEFTLDDSSAMIIQHDQCKPASTHKTRYHQGHPKEQQWHVLFLQLLADISEVTDPTMLQYNQPLSVERNDLFKNIDISYKYILLVGVTRLLGNFVDSVRRMKEMTVCSCIWMG
jgi:hypothetical protein